LDATPKLQRLDGAGAVSIFELSLPHTPGTGMYAKVAVMVQSVITGVVVYVFPLNETPQPVTLDRLYPTAGSATKLFVLPRAKSCATENVWLPLAVTSFRLPLPMIFGVMV
jgi:hypothetical protein